MSCTEVSASGGASGHYPSSPLPPNENIRTQGRDGEEGIHRLHSLVDSMHHLVRLQRLYHKLGNALSDEPCKSSLKIGRPFYPIVIFFVNYEPVLRPYLSRFDAMNYVKEHVTFTRKKLLVNNNRGPGLCLTPHFLSPYRLFLVFLLPSSIPGWWGIMTEVAVTYVDFAKNLCMRNVTYLADDKHGNP